MVAQCRQGTAQGSNEHSQPEEGRSKLLSSPVPPRLGVAVEVQKGATLWEERRFEELLRQAEEHILLSRRPGRKQRYDGPVDASSRDDRARRTAAFLR